MRPTRFHLATVSLLAALAAPHAIAQDKKKDKQKLAETGRELFGGKPKDAKSKDGESAAAWSIVIVAAFGDDQAATAAEALEQVRSRGGLPNAYMEQRGKVTVVAYGAYDDPASPAAQHDLERIRSMEIDRARPFGGALLAPPEGISSDAGLADLDLRHARATYGKDAIYTLQVAVYGPAKGDKKKVSAKDLAEARKAAETAAVQLRREGDLAFFYHGQSRSMVTVGIFELSDFDPLKPERGESPLLVATRERHPYNLLNGKGIKERVPGIANDKDPRAWRMQPSSLVGIPDS